MPKLPIQYDYETESAVRDEYLKLVEVFEAHSKIAAQNGHTGKATSLAEIAKLLRSMRNQLESDKHRNADPLKPKETGAGPKVKS